MMSENSKLCVGCMSFGKAGTMHDWTLDEAQTDEMAAGHLARPTWKSESLRGRTDRVAVGKYDCMEEADMKIVTHVHELAEKYQCKMSQIAIAWQWAKGIASLIIGATKMQYLDDAAGALNIRLTAEDIAYLEECYVPHPIVGAIDKNPAQGVMLLDEKK